MEEAAEEVVAESAPADENDDNWLYGDSNAEQTQEKEAGDCDKEQKEAEHTEPAGEEEDKEQDENETMNDDEHFAEVSRDAANGDADSQENGDSDSDDSDDVKVTIGEIKSVPQSYGSLNIKRGVGLVAAGAADKPRVSAGAGGKVLLEDLEGPGSINGVPALEFNIDTIEDKPWNKPGADISDYFNYGFNEVTWSAYCGRQRHMRVDESGVGLHTGLPPRGPPPDTRRPPGTQQHQQLPRGQLMRNDDNMAPPAINSYQPHENTIQVMTGDRRDYLRGPAHPREQPEYYPPQHEPYYPGPPPHAHYEEPWGHPPEQGWAPTEIKELTPGPLAPPAMSPVPPLMPAPSHMLPAPTFAPPYRPHPPPQTHERERDRDRERERDRMREREERDRRDRERERRDEEERDRERERSRSIKPDRIREKSYRRERSRSRSRRHKSRSRSPRVRERSRDRDRSRDKDRERSTKTKSKDTAQKEKVEEK